MNLMIGDDGYFSTILREKNIFEWMIDMYNNTNARLGINLLLALVASNTSLFILLDIIINVSIMYIIILLMSLKSLTSRLTLLSLLLMFNIHDMSSAGWMATMVNYMWVVFSILLMAYLLKKYYLLGNCIYIYPTSFFILCFAGFSEQGIVILLSMLIYFIYIQYQRLNRLDKNAIILLLFTIFILIIILFSPGNANRMQFEMNGEWASPLFVKNNFLDKIWIGIIRFNALFLAVPQIANHSNFMAVPDHHLTYVFAFILIIHMLSNYKSNIRKMDIVLAFVPATIVAGYYLATLNPFFERVFALPGMPFTIDYYDWSFYSPLFFSSLFIISFIAYVYRNFNSPENNLYNLIFLTGLATQVMMGLSPTIYRSGARTSIYMYFSLLFLTLFLYKDVEREIKSMKKGKLVLFTLIFTLLSISLYDCMSFFCFLVPRGY